MAASFASPPDFQCLGTVGPCTSTNTFRLEAVPEMGYFPSNDPPQGEVLIRGPNVFQGYYKMPEKTAEVLDSDGFFHTGDIGEVTPIGSLRIIDRKKNIFKLSQGEYIAVEKLETDYKSNEFVDQIWVYGDSMKNNIVAIVVPSEQKLMQLVKQGEGDGDEESFEKVCTRQDVRDAVLVSLKETCAEKKLKGFERISAVYLEPEPFSVENGLLTPSFKLQRHFLKKRFQKQIDAMYAQL
eukprot:TRINITY_DN10179_c0_g1_i6.p3 TRINITY_DN10179_c0_g1~~TRINITY_DN10179_c0_g1_i6.p3  ORF type:complete len:254 (-),score=34.02 TRINITY_DN10179_c0_g1_i6:701-1417(-)